MKILGIIILTAIFVIALALGSQNQELVNFNYLFAQGDFQLSTLLGGAFGSGFVLGGILCGLLYLKARYDRRRLSKKVLKQQKEIDTLRTEPAVKG
ncbi:lipopolysaccharide assembly protein LapA domain-containing protein [Vibrio sp. SS-MA-C1-2]|uniref:LapA family protein n=1 Tax=Vibrio sp. SS-MA-C1-2 TaxID=2908646 RepID=UPI001F473DD4|nr:lipopolysaccharide assembly protein LapA domain-containing protein [Vibrio sp. SS-MA-C1-2]UJF19974.1 lipopolysaccharide assembly protein LapA domain-containing protein [Vibrio sp. SS-MA-C1-2]